MKENIYRNKNCGELRIDNKGEIVKLAGWVNSIRTLGGIVFITLRDHFGITQLLVRDENLIDGLTKESIISVTGEVLERESKNPKMPTGDIEVLVSGLTVLGKSLPVLPFEIADAPNTNIDI